MSLALWILQATLALAFAMTGAMKLMRSKDQLVPTQAWVEDFTPGAIRAIGAAELMAAAGLVLPGATGIAPILTPLAATGLVLLMAGAARTHARRHETQMIIVNSVLGALALLVAIGRFGPWPL